MHYFKLRKLTCKQLIDDMAIDFLLSLNFVSMENIQRLYNPAVDLSKFTSN